MGNIHVKLFYIRCHFNENGDPTRRDPAFLVEFFFSCPTNQLVRVKERKCSDGRKAEATADVYPTFTLEIFHFLKIVNS